jgi:subtilisin family serine protease
MALIGGATRRGTVVSISGDNLGSRRLCPRAVCLACLGLAVWGAGVAEATGTPATTGPATPGLAASGAREQFVPGELLVRFQSGVGRSVRESVLSAVRGEIERRLPLPGVVLVNLSRGGVVNATRVAERSDSVVYAEPNFIYEASATTPDDPLFGQLWGLDNTGQTIDPDGAPLTGTPDADIDAPEAWDLIRDSSAVKVAEVDTGIDYNHPDLAPNIWSNPGEIPANDVDDDHNGYVDDVHGYDFLAGDGDPMDENGHGTHVAGTMGAVGNNGIGVTGVGWRARTMALRAGSAGGHFTNAAIAEAFQYAAQNGARVVNGSFGGPVPAQTVSDAITAAPNVVFVFAAGNESSDNDSTGAYPCSDPQPNIVCVAASELDDELAAFSNYGASSVDLAAPGRSIDSTWIGFPAPTVVYSEGFEGSFSWSTGGTNDTWATTTEFAFAGSASLADSPGASYQNDSDSFARSPAIDLTGKVGCGLTYSLDLSTEWNGEPFGSPALKADRFVIEGSPDGSNWEEVFEWFGHDRFTASNDISFLADDQVSFYMRFRLVTDATNTDDGVHVDDVQIACRDASDPGTEGYEFASGTSMAAPHVAGSAALLLAHNPGLSVSQLKADLLGGVDQKPAFTGTTASGGRLNLFNSIQLATPADTTSPETTIDSGPGGDTGTLGGILYTNTTTPSFTFHADEPSTFECKLDAGAYSPCSSGDSFGPLQDGDHSFAVRATDEAGNVDPSPATLRFRIAACTRSGDGSANQLAGTSGNDVVCGFGGNDSVHPGPGNDIVFGGDGGDSVTPNAGGDRLLGGAGNDALDGGTGNDDIDGGPGTDTCNGGPGSDTAVTCETTTGVP